MRIKINEALLNNKIVQLNLNIKALLQELERNQKIMEAEDNREETYGQYILESRDYKNIINSYDNMARICDEVVKIVAKITPPQIVQLIAEIDADKDEIIYTEEPTPIKIIEPVKPWDEVKTSFLNAIKEIPLEKKNALYGICGSYIRNYPMYKEFITKIFNERDELRKASLGSNGVNLADNSNKESEEKLGEENL